MHKSQEFLIKETEKAAKRVKIEGLFYHYKNLKLAYKVLKLAITEANDSVCVIYEAHYDSRLVFVRPLGSWLDRVAWENKTTDRFTLIS